MTSLPQAAPGPTTTGGALVRRWSDRAVARAFETPLRFWVVAAAAGVLSVLALTRTTWEPFHAIGNDEAIAFAGGLVVLAGLLWGVAPLVALRRPLLATLLCALPLGLSLVSEHEWPFSLLVSLVGVAMAAVWRRPWVALVPLALALALVALLSGGAGLMQVPYGAQIQMDGLGRSLTDLAVMVGLYVVAFASAHGVAWWMRSSALRDRRLAQLDARAGEVEERAAAVGERARLAHDLHDVVAHHVSLIAVKAETAPYTHPGLPGEAREVLARIALDARAALDELRGVLGVLQRSEDGAPLTPQPGLAEVPALVEQARAAGEHVTLEVEGDEQVGPATGYAAYRVVQEALTNARRHAHGRPTTVAVSRAGGVLRVQVGTAGVEGVEPGRPEPGRSEAGRGLAGMRERVETLGGTLEAGPTGDGFVVSVELPLTTPEPSA